MSLLFALHIHPQRSDDYSDDTKIELLATYLIPVAPDWASLNQNCIAVLDVGDGLYIWTGCLVHTVG